MPTLTESRKHLNKLTVSFMTLIWVSAGMAQEDPIHLSDTLDVQALYEPIPSLEIHGETAVSLLEELQTKHYSSVEVDDNFSSGQAFSNKVIGVAFKI